MSEELLRERIAELEAGLRRAMTRVPLSDWERLKDVLALIPDNPTPRRTLSSEDEDGRVVPFKEITSPLRYPLLTSVTQDWLLSGEGTLHLVYEDGDTADLTNADRREISPPLLLSWLYAIQERFNSGG